MNRTVVDLSLPFVIALNFYNTTNRRVVAVEPSMNAER